MANGVRNKAPRWCLSVDLSPPKTAALPCARRVPAGGGTTISPLAGPSSTFRLTVGPGLIRHVPRARRRDETKCMQHDRHVDEYEQVGSTPRPCLAFASTTVRRSSHAVSGPRRGIEACWKQV